MIISSAALYKRSSFRRSSIKSFTNVVITAILVLVRASLFDFVASLYNERLPGSIVVPEFDTSGC